MAFSFIGISPNPLPLPAGLEANPRRFAKSADSLASCGTHPHPTKVSVRYTITKPDGRLKPETLVLDPLPEECTVRMLQALMHEHLCLSPRQPVELRYWGQTLVPFAPDGTDRPLAFYAIKNHSELTVVIRPLPPVDSSVGGGGGGGAGGSGGGAGSGGSALGGGASGGGVSEAGGGAGGAADGAVVSIVTRLRVASHKLGAPIPLDDLTADLKVLDLKERLRERLKASPIFLVRGPTPPVPSPPPVVFTLAEPVTLPDGNILAVLDARVGEQFAKDVAAGGGGGKKDKGGGMLKRTKDGLVGSVAETDLWELRLDEAEQKPRLFFNGFALPDEALVRELGLCNNELLYLNFNAPWEPDDPVLPAGGAKGGGGKKKK